MTVFVIIGTEDGAMALTRYEGRTRTHGCAVLPGYEDDIRELINDMRHAPSAMFKFNHNTRPAA